MLFRLPAPDLKRLLKKLAAVQSENTIWNPELGELHASDMDLTILVRSPLLLVSSSSELEAKSSFSLNSKQFSATVSRTSGDVECVLAGTRLILKSKRATFELSTARAETKLHQSPTIPDVQHRLPLSVIRDLLQFASSASASAERNNFTGAVQLKALGENLLRAAGTDHKRLAMVEAAIPVPPDFSLLCPVAAVQALSTLEGDKLTIGETDSQIFFASELGPSASTIIIARKLVKAFPDFGHLVTDQCKFRANLDAEALRESLYRVSPMIEESQTGVRRMRLVFGDTLKLVVGESLSKAEDEVDYEAVIPDPLFEQPSFEVAVDHRYLSDFFADMKGAADGKTVQFSGTDARSPVWLTSGHKRLLLVTLR